MRSGRRDIHWWTAKLRDQETRGETSNRPRRGETWTDKQQHLERDAQPPSCIAAGQSSPRRADAAPGTLSRGEGCFNFGRKNTQSKFTTKKMMLSLIIAFCALAGLMLKPVSSYSLTYYDCRHPTNVNKFAQPTVCDPFVAEGEVTTGKTYEVLANTEIREVSGWSCEVIASEWTYRCSVFSHMKLSGMPHLLRHSVVTPEKSRGMVRSEHFTPEGRTAGMMLKFN
ncbi:MAG: hypothetical protein GY696_08750, partial [Gammaproteobacteria bacterium]|nr:hypothetical protein [Gammaproteobacteria bacterium]